MNSTYTKYRAYMSYIFFGCFIVVAILVTVIPVIKRSSRPYHGLDISQIPDNPRYMPPHNPQEFVRLEEAKESPVILFGPTNTYHYTEEFHEKTLFLSDYPPKIIEAQADEEVTLLDGSRISIAALRIERLTSGNFQEVFYTPLFETMEQEEFDRFKDILNRRQPHTRPYDQMEGLPYVLTVYIKHNMNHLRFETAGIYDPETGGSLSPLKHEEWHENFLDPKDPEAAFIQYIDWKSELVGLEPTEADLHLSVKGGGGKSYKVDIDEPTPIVFSGMEYPVQEIIRLSEDMTPSILHGDTPDWLDKAKLGNRVIVGFKENPPFVRAPSLVDEEWKVYTGQEKCPCAFVDAQAYTEKEVLNMCHFWDVEPVYLFDVPEGVNLSHFEMTLEEQSTRIIFRLPEIPVGDPRNKDRPFLEKQLPDLTLVDDDALVAHIKGIFRKADPLTRDAELKHRFRGWSAGINLNNKIPASMIKPTVGEVLEVFQTQYPEAHYVFSQDYMTAADNLGREYDFSEKGLLSIGFLFSNFHLMSIYIYIFLLMKIIALIFARNLQKILFLRGYSFRIWEAEYILLTLKKKAYKIPPRDEVAAIPGVDPDKVKDINELMKKESWW